VREAFATSPKSIEGGRGTVRQAVLDRRNRSDGDRPIRTPLADADAEQLRRVLYGHAPPMLR